VAAQRRVTPERRKNMSKIGTLTVTALLMTGVAFAGEHTIQSNSEVKEQTSHATTVDPSLPPMQEESHNATMESHKSTSQATQVDPSGEVKIEKKHSTTASSATNHSMDGDNAQQSSSTHSEKQSQQSTTDVTP
jgi:hypothetical protein